MINKIKELSVFFPAFNEADNIGLSVEAALKILPEVAEKFEVIIVDDGSSDQTLEVGKNIALSNDLVRVVTQPNKGYGGAIKLGLSSARFEWIFFTDADLQFDLQELKKFVPFVDKNMLILGFRVNRVEGWKRQIFASALKVWNSLFLLFPINIKDPDCAFKLLPKQAALEMVPLISDGAMISTEIIMKAKLLGFPMTQIGVRHYPRKFGVQTGNKIKVITRAIGETFKLQKHLLTDYVFVTNRSDLESSRLSLGKQI